jgi:hypothetical protein
VTAAHEKKGGTMRVLVGLVATLGLSAGLNGVAAPADPTACTLTPEAPYRHTRTTGQKQVYGRGYFSCTGARSALNIEVRLNVYQTSRWYVYGRSQMGYGKDGPYPTALAYEFLCNNYGWGGSIDGIGGQTAYFRTEVRGRYYDASTGKFWTTPWKASGYRALSC